MCEPPSVRLQEQRQDIESILKEGDAAEQRSGLLEGLLVYDPSRESEGEAGERGG